MMEPQSLINGIVNMTNLAEATGMPAHERVWSLLIAALAVVDREMPGGTSREEWVNVCAHVYDEVRSELEKGPES